MHAPLRASLVLAPIILVACSASSPEGAASGESALSSATRSYLVSVSERARVLCRDGIDDYYCGAPDTAAAVQRCAATLAAAGAQGWVRVESSSDACQASGPIYPDPASCLAPVPKNCAYYAACVDRQAPCGESGYALGYGEKYCTAFKNVTTFTPAGVAWRDSVLHCLQLALVPYSQPASQASCDDILTTAFDSHPRCYTRPEHSICFLPPTDVLSILSTIGAQELLAARSRAQIASTIKTCVAQLGAWVFGAHGAATDAKAHEAGRRHPEIVADPEALRAQHAMWKSLERQYAE